MSVNSLSVGSCCQGNHTLMNFSIKTYPCIPKGDSHDQGPHDDRGHHDDQLPTPGRVPQLLQKHHLQSSHSGTNAIKLFCDHTNIKTCIRKDLNRIE